VEFYFMGTVITFALILVFSAANLGMFLYLSGAKERFSPGVARHGSGGGNDCALFRRLQLAQAMACTASALSARLPIHLRFNDL
jgi:hypothetical protein